MKRILVLTLPALVVSCERAVVREYEAPKEALVKKFAAGEHIHQAQGPDRASLRHLKAPPNWRQQPADPMRKASFVVEGENGTKVDISVTSFQGESGGLLANINRWREQLGLDAAESEQLESITAKRTVRDRQFVIVDFVNDQTTSKNKQRIIGAIVSAEGETWFFKMTGEQALGIGRI
jgi:hypothetical protein